MLSVFPGLLRLYQAEGRETRVTGTLGVLVDMDSVPPRRCSSAGVSVLANVVSSLCRNREPGPSCTDVSPRSRPSSACLEVITATPARSLFFTNSVSRRDLVMLVWDRRRMVESLGGGEGSRSKRASWGVAPFP